MRTKNILVLSCVMLAVGLIGCDNAYSHKRIERRLTHQREFVVDCQKSARIHAQRCREAEETLREWQREREERWNRIAPTVGDYVY